MKRILRIVLLAAFIGAFLYTLYYLNEKNNEPEARYAVETVSNRDIFRKTVATGSVIPRKEILIKPVVSGIITKLYREAGEPVKKGDMLARVKVIPDMVSLNNAQNRVDRANIQLDNATVDYNRFRELFETDVISQADFQPYKLAYDNAVQEVDAAEDNLSIVREGISKKSGTATNTLVRSTIDGMVLDVPVKEGNQVIESNTFNEGTTIAAIADMSNMIFEGYLDESEVGKVSEGMELILTIGALQDREFQAQLEYIAPKGTTVDGAIQFLIRAAVNLPDSGFIRAGYSANANIVLDKRLDVLAVDEALVAYEGDAAFVYVETGNQQFEKTAVELGLSDGIHSEVLSGISADSKLRGKQEAAPGSY